ncbi:MAG: hypothetical protein OXG05_07225 [Gammaproteobacteria bacterium]|nr:hypothetical protein [Gammaproteobacteria bacterium]
MKDVLFTSRSHKFQLALWLFIVVVVPLNLRIIDSSRAAGASAMFLVAALAYGESISFIRRTMAWELNKLVPAYRRKILRTSLGIVGVYFALAFLVSVVMQSFTPPIGLAWMITMVSLVVTCYTRRTDSKLGSIYLTLIFCFALVFWTLFTFAPVETRSVILVSISNMFVQLVGMAVALIATWLLKREFEKITIVSDTFLVAAMERFHPNVAGRLRISGWAAPSVHALPSFIWPIPIIGIVFVSVFSFEHGGLSVWSNHSLVLSIVTGIIVYIGTGTPFGLLKNPGLWMGQAWQFGLGDSRVCLGTEYARRILKASIFPSAFVVCFTLVHAIFIEKPSADWSGYANFYDEALLLITVNLLCFTWACAAYPKRTTKFQDFLQIRIDMCVGACFIFMPGLDFGLLVRTLLLITLICSVALAIYVGGGRVAEIDFVRNKRSIQSASAIE